MAMFKLLMKCVISDLILFWHNMTPLLGDVTIKKKTQKKPKIYMQGNTCNSQSSSIIQVVWTLYSDFIVPIGIDLYLKP